MNHRAKVTICADVLAYFIVPIVKLKLVVSVSVVKYGLLVSSFNFFKTERIALFHALIKATSKFSGCVVKVDPPCGSNSGSFVSRCFCSFVLISPSNLTNQPTSSIAYVLPCVIQKPFPRISFVPFRTSKARPVT